jgi:uncharacterized LabA/DUF88 family protein
MTKVACYIDGFNLYHAIDALSKPYLKWLNLRALAESLCRPGEMLVKVAYFSAYATWLADRYARHRLYVAALEATGVECHMARFSERVATCKTCGASWKSREEKETDVHFALTFLEDAIDHIFDRAIIVSADSDYIPAVRKVRKRLPGKQIFLAIPPERFGQARGLIDVCGSKTAITAGRLARHLFGPLGRPREYDPPRGWMPPS